MYNRCQLISRSSGLRNNIDFKKAKNFLLNACYDLGTIWNIFSDFSLVGRKLISEICNVFSDTWL